MQITMNRALRWKHTFIRNEPQSNYWQLMLLYHACDIFVELITEMRHHDFETHLSRCLLVVLTSVSCRLNPRAGLIWLIDHRCAVSLCLWGAGAVTSFTDYQSWQFFVCLVFLRWGLMLYHNTFCHGHFSGVWILVNSIHNRFKPEMKSLFWGVTSGQR